MNILEAFADETLCITPTVYKGNPAYRKALRAMCEATEALDAKLDDEGKKLLEQLSGAQMDESHLYAVDQFVRGYRIGMLMMLEVLTGGSDLLHEDKPETP